MLVGSRMTTPVYTVTAGDTIAGALRLARTQRIRHVPVVDGDRLVGLVTERDLRHAAPPIDDASGEEIRETIHSKKVGDVMVTTVITATTVTPVEAAAKLLYENRIGCLPVTEGDRLVGILTESDLLRALVELFGAHHPLTRIEIQLANRAGELARVVRVIGIEHKVNISGLIVPPSGTEQYSSAIVQLQTTDPTPIIETLRKLGYKVGWPALDADPQSQTEDAALSRPSTRRVPVEM
jgi:acetoin utilization protein AcuB